MQIMEVKTLESIQTILFYNIFYIIYFRSFFMDLFSCLHSSP